MKNSQARRNLIARQSGEHNHDHAQVLIGWRGRMDCRFDDTAGRLASGRAALVPAGAGHLYAGLSDDSELLVIDVSFVDPYIRSLESACALQFSDTLFQRPEIITLDAVTLPLLDFAATQLQQAQQPGKALISCQLVSLFMTQLCQLYSSNSTRLAARARLDIAELNRFIDRRLAEPPSNAQLASAMNLSESHFYALCQHQLGVTPQHYLMHRRLQQAQYLLLNSRMPLAALAQEVGFADASSFSRAFKNHFSETPGAARRSMQAPRQAHRARTQ